MRLLILFLVKEVQVVLTHVCTHVYIIRCKNVQDSKLYI